MSDTVTLPEETIGFLLGALHIAHGLVEAAIEGKPLSANRLENYYNEVQRFIGATELEGSLIEAALQELSEETDLEELRRLLCAPSDSTPPSKLTPTGDDPKQ
jgi:hypothetical protein